LTARLRERTPVFPRRRASRTSNYAAFSSQCGGRKLRHHSGEAAIHWPSLDFGGEKGPDQPRRGRQGPGQPCPAQATSLPTWAGPFLFARSPRMRTPLSHLRGQELAAAGAVPRNGIATSRCRMRLGSRARATSDSASAFEADAARSRQQRQASAFKAASQRNIVGLARA
jgi:hypothetical protein